MTTLRLKYALMAGAAMAMMVLPMGTMMTATAQEDELAEDVDGGEPAGEMSDEALDSDAEIEPSEATGLDDDVEAGTDDAAVPEEAAPATDDAGAVPLGEDDGGSRAKTGPPT